MEKVRKSSTKNNDICFGDRWQVRSLERYVTCLQIIRDGLNRQSVSWLLTDEEKQRKYFDDTKSAVVSQLPKSLEVTLCDFFLFPSKTLPLRGRNFQDIRDT